MKIAIDCHTIGEKQTGNETYVRNTVTALAGIDGTNEYHLFYTPRQKNIRRIEIRNSNFRERFLNFSNPVPRILFDIPFNLLKERHDVLLVQYVAPPFCPCPFVAVIHDISYEIVPDIFTKTEEIRFKLTIPFTAKRAKKIITCSENTKKDLVNIYKIDPGRIEVIYYGVNDIFRKKRGASELAGIKNKYAGGKDFIIYVGNLQPRKNLKRLIEAFTSVRKNHPVEHKLVIVGKKAWLYDDIFASARDSGLSDEIVFTDYISDDELALLYRTADFSVYPSLYEGFGLPVVEAMASGIPVITSNNSSLREIAEGASLLINPESVEEIGSAILALVKNRELHEEVRQKGLKRAELYDWNRTAARTMQLFERIAEK